MITISGVQEIDKVLSELPMIMTHNILGSAHLLAAKPLVEKEKLTAPEGPTGNLVDSIGAYKISIARAGHLGEVRVGPRRKPPFKGFAGHLVEFGTKRRTNKNGANRGIMPAHPFAKPAFDQTKAEVEGLIAQSIGRVVLRTMKRYLK